jgi:hypothetical protein
MTRSDSVMLTGCLAVALLAMFSLSAAAPAAHSTMAMNLPSPPATLQLSRVQSLTAKSARSLSAF